MAIKEGSKVWLKVGGPAMVVSEKDHNTGHWRCQWFLGHTVMEKVLTEASLTEKDPNTPNVRIV